MDMTISYHSFRIEIRPSSDTNDHEVRFIADGVDLIDRHWSDMIGLDPDDILKENCALLGSEAPATIARCTCGVIGCGSVGVRIRRSEDQVVWEGPESSDPHRNLRLYFPAAEAYLAEVERALHDHSWETPDRTAARLVVPMLDCGALAEKRMKFFWASGRSKADHFSVSFMLEPGPYQLVVHIPWRSEAPEEIAKTLARILRQPPESWPSVEWHPQAKGLPDPPIKGPGWRPAR